MTTRSGLTDLPAYSALEDRARVAGSASIAALFEADPGRTAEFTVEAAGLQLDFSKHLLDADTLSRLLELADQAGLRESIEELFNGSHVNNTERRPALHTLLRSSGDGGQPERYQEVAAARSRMQAIAQSVGQGKRAGFSGAPITDVVNIGIGGSDLGPRLVTEALRPFHAGIRCHYVANVDPADLQGTLAELNPASTLFIICSKSFRTEETRANGLAARDWVLRAGASNADLAKHFLAVTSNIPAAVAFGLTEENCLPMWDWVGGRYSVWSAVGLSCAIAIGGENFSRFLAGAERMDRHFRGTTPRGNMPMLMSLLELWNCNFLGAGNHVVLPYDHTLRRLPDYLQQLTMESNGKRVNTDGDPLSYPTAPILWGSAGTMGQHSFHQLLHQGQRLCPVDFVLPLNTHTDNPRQHSSLVANCLAQSRVLMVGRSLEEALTALMQRGLDEESARELAPHLSMPGNRPNSIITMAALNPETLGALLALYEHRTFCSGQLWRINSFDQWGVELGKELSSAIFARLEGGEGDPMDPATERLIQAWKSAQKAR